MNHKWTQQDGPEECVRCHARRRHTRKGARRPFTYSIPVWHPLGLGWDYVRVSKEPNCKSWPEA